jgi:hypothetical protein
MAKVGLANITRYDDGTIKDYNGLLPDDHSDVLIANRAITHLNDLLVTRASDCWSKQVVAIRNRLALGDSGLYRDLRRPKEHWHREFEIIACETRDELYERMGKAIGKTMSGMAEGRGGTFTLACGPVPNFPYAAEEINRRKVPLGDKVFLAAMDDWAVQDSEGDLYYPPDVEGSFKHTFEEVLLGKIDPDLKPDDEMVQWGEEASFRARRDRQMGYDRRVINYGVGAAMHRAFFDPNHAKALQEVGIDPRNVVYLLGARVTEETLAQNMITGYSFGCPSYSANTIGPVLLNDVPTFGIGGCDGWYSDCGESWQIDAIQTVLALPEPDVTAIASYLPCKPGILFILEPLLKKPSGEVH